MKQIQAIGSESDIVFKTACDFKLDASKNIKCYANILIPEWPEIKDTIVQVQRTDIELRPFEM
ncbi:MAG: hypothetical protein ACRCSI_13720, partial [Eubacterium aggregans]